MTESARYGKWKVIEPIGRGGQGQVYLVRDTSLVPTTEDRTNALRKILMTLSGSGPIETLDSEKAALQFADEIRRIVGEFQVPTGALKKLLPFEEGTAEDEAAAIERMKRELLTLESIDHPSLVKVVDSNLDDRWFVMEFFEGGALSNDLGKYKGRVLEALRAFRAIVDAVSALHAEKIVHRDIKPDNIFVAPDGHLVLADCGLAFKLENQERLTQTFENVGTRDFQPPWSIGMRLADVHPRFDVFSLAKVLWTMVSARPKFPLWYFAKPENDLHLMFPDEPAIQFVHKILEKCVVEQQDAMILHDASELLSEVDTAIAAVSRGCHVPGRKTRMLCRFCGIGTYKKSDNFQIAGNPRPQHERNYFLCDHCGHLESFFWPYQAPPAWLMNS